MHSQNNEEEIIRNYFKGHKGNFLDCGANDGITLSNTYALMLDGWNGVYVEASPKAFKRLKFNIEERQGLYFYNFALGEHNGEITLNESGSHLGDDVGLLSTVISDEMNRWPNEKFEPVKVQCFRWKTFLNRLTIKKFDFISIDIEGMDYAVLSQIDLTDTACVCVEWNGKDKEKFDSLMTGFKLIGQNAENLIYGRS